MGDDGNTIFVLNFVADAFKDLQAYFQKALTAGRIESELTVFRDFQATLAWDAEVGIHSLYNAHMNDVYTKLVSRYIDSFTNQTIKNFDDFVKVFLSMATLLCYTVPITRMGFCTSNKTSPRTSGLVIELVEGKHDDDYGKYIGFIRDNNFSFFTRACERHGFLVDKNAPWRLFADITNPYMQDKMMAYGLASVEDVFPVYYLKAGDYEMENLKVRLFQMYDLFVKQYPDVTNLASTGDETKISFEARDTMTMEAIREKYNDDYWLRLLIYLRAVETRKAYDQMQFEKSVRLASEYMHHVGMWRAVQYVEDTYKHTPDELTIKLEKNLTEEQLCVTLRKDMKKDLLQRAGYRPSFHF
jgi:hypothetical protein